MMTTTGWATPEGLSINGQRAAEIIRDFLMDKDLANNAGGQFYSAKQWRDRGETYGTESLLVIVHDGDPAATVFNWDESPDGYALREELQSQLDPLGVYFEAGTNWYTTVHYQPFPRKRFDIDGDDHVFGAIAFDRPWNGWAVPIVDEDTVRAVVDRVNSVNDERMLTLSAEHGPVGKILTLTERDRLDNQVLALTELEPIDRHCYRLDLGWTFTERAAEVHPTAAPRVTELLTQLRDDVDYLLQRGTPGADTIDVPTFLWVAAWAIQSLRSARS